MLAENELELFIAATGCIARMTRRYTLVFFGKKLRQNWAGHFWFCIAARFVVIQQAQLKAALCFL